MSRKAPSLVKLCAGTVIANLRYVGDVSGIDLHLLKDILPHCTVDQLLRIEDSTEEVDLSPVTNDLWKRFYEQHFGEESMKLVIKRMKQKQVVFKWRKLYEAKKKERQVFQNKSVERLKQRYEEELAKKQSKRIQICSKIPPSGSKRSFSSVSSSYKVSHIKGNLMKKARLEYLKSKEACIQATLRKKFEQRKSLPPQRFFWQHSRVKRTLRSCARISPTNQTKQTQTKPQVPINWDRLYESGFSDEFYQNHHVL